MPDTPDTGGKRIADAISAYYDRDKPIIQPLASEFDVSGYQICQGKPQRVLTKNQTAYTRNGGLHELITSIECVAADGWKMSPWFLVKGQYHMENWYRTTSLPSDYTIAPTLNGYTSNAIAIHVLIFRPRSC